MRPPPEQVQRHLGDAEPDGADADQDERPVTVQSRDGGLGDRPVDRRLGEQRYGDLSA